jgi:hypothetical protein
MSMLDFFSQRRSSSQDSTCKKQTTTGYQTNMQRGLVIGGWGGGIAKAWILENIKYPFPYKVLNFVNLFSPADSLTEKVWKHLVLMYEEISIFKITNQRQEQFILKKWHLMWNSE